jgi:hypothetical protein
MRASEKSSLWCEAVLDANITGNGESQGRAYSVLDLRADLDQAHRDPRQAERAIERANVGYELAKVRRDEKACERLAIKRWSLAHDIEKLAERKLELQKVLCAAWGAGR